MQDLQRGAEVVLGLQLELEKACNNMQVQEAMNLQDDLDRANYKLGVMAKSNRTLQVRVRDAGIVQLETRARGVEAENTTLREKLQCFEQHWCELLEQEEAAAKVDKVEMAKVSSGQYA